MKETLKQMEGRMKESRLKELKSRVYDLIVLRERSQQEIEALSREIAKEERNGVPDDPEE